MTTPQIYAIYIISISFITFLAYLFDKIKATAHTWRTPEKVLLTLSLLGGGFGGYGAMLLFRHKTKHWYFTAINLFSIVLHVGGLVCAYIFL